MRTGAKTIWRYAPIAAVVAVLLLAYGLGAMRFLSIDALYGQRDWLEALVAEHAVLSALGFVALYAAAVAVAFPAPVVFTIAGGFLFGWWLGGILSILGATLGGTLLFLAARTAFADILRRRAGGAIGHLADGFRRDAFTYLLVLRLTPVLPFALLNIVPAILGVHLRAFVGATVLGIIPGGLVYAFLGSGLDRALAAAGGPGGIEVSDLLTPDMIAALAGLTVLALLGLVLKRRFVEPSPAVPGES